MDFLVRQIESDDFITVGVDADIQSRAVDDQMQLTCFRTWAGLGFVLRCRAEVLVEPPVGGAPGLGTLLTKPPHAKYSRSSG